MNLAKTILKISSKKLCDLYILKSDFTSQFELGIQTVLSHTYAIVDMCKSYTTFNIRSGNQIVF